VDVRVALVRHGETDWNANARYQGQRDTPLNDNGLRQARALGGHMACRRVLAVFSSDLERARITAEHVAAPHGLSVSLRAGLREMAFGDWENLTAREIASRWPGLYSQWLDDPVSTRPPNGENLTELLDRSVAALHGIIAESTAAGSIAAPRRRIAGPAPLAPNRHEAGDDIPTIVVVSHGGPIRALLCEILGLPPKEGFWSVEASPGGYAVVRSRGGSVQEIVRSNPRGANACAGAGARLEGLVVERVNVIPA